MSDSRVSLNMVLPFPKAGVAFDIRVEPEEGTASSFSVSATHISGNEALPFRVDVSPCLADWVRGYTRWLVRAGVTAPHDDTSIRGTFVEGMTAEQILLGVRDACDMIRQRFDLYEESVLA